MRKQDYYEIVRIRNIYKSFGNIITQLRIIEKNLKSFGIDNVKSLVEFEDCLYDMRRDVLMRIKDVIFQRFLDDTANISDAQKYNILLESLEQIKKENNRAPKLGKRGRGG